MEDLQYIIGIGFSGADIGRAVFLAFVFAMYAKKDSNIWRMALIALVIDRTIWPITAMAVSGAEAQAIIASIGALFTTLFDDLGIYFVRYLGIVVLISGFVGLRAGVHKFIPKKRKAAHA